MTIQNTLKSLEDTLRFLYKDNGIEVLTETTSDDSIIIDFYFSDIAISTYATLIDLDNDSMDLQGNTEATQLVINGHSVYVRPTPGELVQELVKAIKEEEVC